MLEYLVTSENVILKKTFLGYANTYHLSIRVQM